MKNAPLLVIIFLIIPVLLNAQESDTTETGYEFTMLKQLPATPVKNQYRTSTCWSFSAISMLESELLRMGKGAFDLSEMFIARNVYERKARKYVRMHGKLNFAPGGAFNDVTAVMRDLGLMPDEAYPGLEYDEEKHIHGELDAVLKGYVDALIKNPNRRLTPVWDEGLSGILDAYLGEEPERFTWEGKEYTPRTFMDNLLELNADDYVMLSSYTHHPFYKQFVLEVPDNWDYGLVHNVPLAEFMATIEHAINTGYTVAWAADVSEHGFDFKKGIAVLPAKEWTEMEKSERDSVFIAPIEEKTVTQAIRQKTFDNYTTTDDHGMHITGIAEDQNGTTYFYVKNSWGIKGSKYDGYFYASAPYVACKTLSILLHKDAVPADIRAKLGI